MMKLFFPSGCVRMRLSTLLLVLVGSFLFGSGSDSGGGSGSFTYTYSHLLAVRSLCNCCTRTHTKRICFRFPFLLRAVFLFEFCMFFSLFVSYSFFVSLPIPSCRSPVSLLSAQFQIVPFLLFKLSFFSCYTRAFHAPWPKSFFPSIFLLPGSTLSVPLCS